jgi:hypothetical protein
MENAQEKISSFLSQECGDREEMGIPRPIHPAWAGRLWLSGVGGFGFESSLGVRGRIRGRNRSGVLGGVRCAWH